MKEIKVTSGEIRIITPGGVVDINVSLRDYANRPVVRVDTVTDEGWTAVNGDPGVVRMINGPSDAVVPPLSNSEAEKITREYLSGMNLAWVSPGCGCHRSPDVRIPSPCPEHG